VTHYAGPIIDAHHHVWDPLTHHYPWLSGEEIIEHRYGDYSPIKRPYLPVDYRRDVAGHDVVGSVYVEAEWAPDDPIGETKFVHGLAETTGCPNAMIAQAWLHEPNAAEILAAQAAFPLVRSVRHKPGGARSHNEALGKRTMMTMDRWREGYSLLASHGLHFDLQVPWWHLEEAATLARDFPETLLIVNHAGVPGDRSPETLSWWRAGMEAVAVNHNAAVKLSGICVPGRAWSREDAAPIVHDTIAIFGADRVMVGSNFPVDGLLATFDTIFSTFKDLTSDLSAQDQRAIFHDNAQRIYRPMDLRRGL
jgi:predicted TIM-barrel fold metal-dependent hydrolase